MITVGPLKKGETPGFATSVFAPPVRKHIYAFIVDGVDTNTDTAMQAHLTYTKKTQPFVGDDDDGDPT